MSDADPARHPIDATPSVPPPKGKDYDYLTRDITGALERAVLARVERLVDATGMGRREAAMRILKEIEQ